MIDCGLNLVDNGFLEVLFDISGEVEYVKVLFVIDLMLVYIYLYIFF